MEKDPPGPLKKDERDSIGRERKGRERRGLPLRTISSSDVNASISVNV